MKKFIPRFIPGLGLALFALAAQAQNYTAPTPPAGDSSNRIATTAFVGTALTALPLANNKVFVGNASNVAAAVTMTGDCGIINTGAITCTKVNGVSFPAGPSTNTVPVVTSSNTVAWQQISNAQVSSSAAIAYSKLSLTNSILNADINSAAGIVYSKLNLSNSILNADINTAAAIAYSKLSLANSILNADINSAAAIASTKLSFTHSATGGVAENVGVKLQQITNIMDFGAAGNGVTDDTTAYNNFLAACQASIRKTCYIPAGSYNITSQPSSITVGITLFGDGYPTILIRNFNGSGTTGFIDISPTATGTAIRGLSVQDAAGTSGGNTITGKSDASNALSQLVFEDLYLTTAGTDTHAYTIYLDGSAKTTGAVGIRIVEFRNVGAFGAATAGVLLKSVVGANWSGAGSYTAGGTSTTSFVIDGVAAVPSNYINLAPDIANGCINLGRAANVILEVASLGACGGVSVVNTANTDLSYLISPAVSGTVQANWTNSGQITPGGSGDVTAVGDCATAACFTGASGTTLTFLNATSGSIALTPVTGALGSRTLSLPAATDTLVGKATTDTLTNKTLTSPTINGGTHTAITSLGIRSTGAAFDLLFASSEAITANRTLSFNVGNAARALTLSGDLTINGGTAITPGVAGQVGTWSGGTLSGSATPTLGAAGTLGSVTMGNATSGLLTLQPVTGALGTVTVSLPAATDTLVGKATTDTLTNKSINLANNTLTSTSAQLATALSDETGTGVSVFGTAPTFTTSITDPLVIGGTGVGSDLILQSTSGVGDGTDYVYMKGGNAGATTYATHGAELLAVGATAPYAYGGSYTNFQMNTILGMLSGADGTAEFQSNVYWNGSNYIYRTTAAASKVGFGSGSFVITTAPSGTAGNTATMGIKLAVSNAGIGNFSKGANVASASAITITGNVFHVTGTTTVTSIASTDSGGAAIQAGVCITIIFDGALTFTDGSNLKLASNFVTTADDTITLAYDGTNWYEMARSVN